MVQNRNVSVTQIWFMRIWAVAVVHKHNSPNNWHAIKLWMYDFNSNRFMDALAQKSLRRAITYDDSSFSFNAPAMCNRWMNFNWVYRAENTCILLYEIDLVEEIRFNHMQKEWKLPNWAQFESICLLRSLKGNGIICNT